MSIDATPVTIGGRPSTEAIYNQREAEKAQANLAREQGGAWRVEKVGSKYRVYQTHTPKETEELAQNRSKMFSPSYDPASNRLDGTRLDACETAIGEIGQRLDAYERSRHDSGPQWSVNVRNSEGQESFETVLASDQKAAEREVLRMAKQSDPGGKWKVIGVSAANAEARGISTASARAQGVRRDAMSLRGSKGGTFTYTAGSNPTLKKNIDAVVAQYQAGKITMDTMATILEQLAYADRREQERAQSRGDAKA